MMIRDKYAVRLAPEQREELQNLIRVGKSSARVTAKAWILLRSDDLWAAPKVTEALDVALDTMYRTKQRFTEDGLDGALWDRRQVHRHRKLDERGEAHLIALACSPAPEGRTTGLCACWLARWWSWGWRPPCPTKECVNGSKTTISSRGRSRNGASPR